VEAYFTLLLLMKKDDPNALRELLNKCQDEAYALSASYRRKLLFCYNLALPTSSCFGSIDPRLQKIILSLAKERDDGSIEVSNPFNSQTADKTKE
jgi:hypothetical protein